MHRPILLATIAGLCLPLIGTRASTQTCDPRGDDAVVLQAFMDSAAANRYVGAQVAILRPGRAVTSASFGRNGAGTPMADSVLLGTGSISKTIAAVAVLRMIDQGRVSADDTLGRWFASWPALPPSLPVRALLRHQSGLSEYASHPGYAAAVNADRSRSWTPIELLQFIPAPDFAAFTRWRASNSDRLLLTVIVERVSGMPYGEFVRRELLGPTASENWTPGSAIDRRASIGTHWRRESRDSVTDLSRQWFGPTLFTTRIETYLSARATARFAQRLFDGDLLSASTRQMLTTFVADDGRIPGQTSGGVGIRQYVFGGRVYCGNSGGTPNSSAMYLFDPESRIVIAMSTNQDGPSHGNSHLRVVPALMALAAGEGR